MTFQCQRCGHALKIDDSLTHMDEASTDVLLAPLIAEEQLAIQTQKQRSTITKPTKALHTRLITKPSGKQPGPSESFVVLTHPETQPPPSTDNTSAIQSSTKILLQASPMKAPRDMNNSLSHRLKVANRLFDITSSKSSVDHPMCQECTDLLLEHLQKQMTDVGRERDCYIDFLKKVKDSRVTAEEEAELTRQVDELMLAEQEAQEELDRWEKEEKQLDEELAALTEEVKRLDQQEQVFWETCNTYQLDLQTFQNERDSINLKYDHDVRQYERLQKTVVYNDAFCISQDGPFGTINGFRLGKLSTHPVEWSEINAAWGQTLLLLYTVANKLRFQFKTYRLVPLGSFSKVQKVNGDVVVDYELYGSGDFGINKMLFLNRKFDHAMVAVLNCLEQLTDFAEERDRATRLPYRINKDKIGELSVRIQFNQLDQWTKALKYMLVNMKYILAFASRFNAIDT